MNEFIVNSLRSEVMGKRMNEYNAVFTGDFSMLRSVRQLTLSKMCFPTWASTADSGSSKRKSCG